jgi:ornithine cyclodeaminase
MAGIASDAPFGGIRWIDDTAIRSALPMAAAIDRLDERLRADGFPDTPPRAHVEAAAGTLLTMPGVGSEGVGVKLVTVAPGNRELGLPLIHGVYVLFDVERLMPIAVLEAAALTELRTAAVSAVATRALARRDGVRLVVFGAGAQARAHVDAMAAVCELRSVAIVDLAADRAEQLAAYARHTGIESRVSGPEAVADADVVCTCTTSRTPLFDGTLLPAGAHVNAMGAFQPDARELDDATARRARFVVETRAGALAEAGDLLIPLSSGAIGPDQIVGELPAVLNGQASGGDGDITVFKSVGHAYEDLVVAAAVLEAIL